MNIKNARRCWGPMVLSDLSPSDLPTLRGNPFDSRPIERNRVSEIVGREDILIRWKEHMHSQSPRLILLTGERGSGRTSLINAISSQTNDRFVGTYWHRDDPLNCALDELAITFCGHDIPPSMHQKVERIVETLDTAPGPLPLVALDYPSHVDLSSFLPLVLPVLQRLRALVVVSVSNSQLMSLDENTRAVFDEVANVEPFSHEQIQLLSDLRISRMSPERWHINSDLLGAIMSRTGGNARSVIGILRDLVDERRGLGSKDTLASLKSWNPPVKPTVPEKSSEEPQVEPFVTPIDESKTDIVEEIEESWSEEEEIEPETTDQVLEDEDWDVEPDDMWPEEEEIEPESANEGREEEYSETISEDPGKITGWTPEEGTLLSIEEGSEPPSSVQPRGFSGLVSRSRLTNDQMPTGPDYSTPIQEPEILESEKPHRETPTNERKPQFSEENRNSISTESRSIEEKQVLFSEGELWTVDSELEETLPEISNETVFEPEDVFEEPDPLEMMDEQSPASQPERTIVVKAPTWESGDLVDQYHLGRMNDAERLVVSVAASREISPSDAEIQARLEVGRPRLSQIYNSLHKSGILAVRKEGRSRLFKLSEAAGELLSEG